MQYDFVQWPFFRPLSSAVRRLSSPFPFDLFSSRFTAHSSRLTVHGMNIQELKKKREISVVERNGGSKVRIFGSLARGEGLTESDVDILIELDPGRSLLDILAIKQDLEDLLHRNVDVLTESAVSPYIKDDILSEAVSL
jgi:predicted nucleotidyltransferase